ncbi:MAG: restriction endonuclease subunit S [Spartobacteria bacterium]|nr:restriction endonuclease subunit S [Spartobacteria bacterium]
MKLKPYPEYMASGVEWLGDVPSHWEPKRLKIAAQLLDKKIEADEDAPLPYIGLENIESWTGRIVGLNPDMVPSGTANQFSSGHVLFGKLRPYLAKACAPDFDGLCSTELLVLGPADFERQALLYFLLSDGFINLVDSSTFGSKMPRANWDFIGNCIAPVPPPDEQTVIADFLDRETGKIDRLVAKKRELIAKLKEKRAALITRAVTRGLNPDAKLKPSGIEWLGDIPEHWEVKKLSWLFRYAKGRNAAMLTKEYVASNPGDFPVFSGQTANEGLMGLIDWHEFEFAEPVIFVTTVGARAMSTRLVSGAFSLSQNCALIIPIDSKVDVRFYEAALHPLFEYEKRSISLIMQPSLRFDDLDRFRVPKPPPDEQQEIADFIESETVKMDGLVQKVEEAILRLQEYRTALITAAVTGKIDLRGAVGENTDTHGQARTKNEETLVYPEPKSELRMVAEGKVPKTGTITIDFEKGTA